MFSFLSFHSQISENKHLGNTVFLHNRINSILIQPLSSAGRGNCWTGGGILGIFGRITGLARTAARTRRLEYFDNQRRTLKFPNSFCLNFTENARWFGSVWSPLPVLRSTPCPRWDIFRTARVREIAVLAEHISKTQEFTYEFFTFRRPIETSLVYPTFSGKRLYRRFENFPCSFRIIVIEWCRSRFLIFSFFEFSSIVSFAVYLSNCLSFEREP